MKSGGTERRRYPRGMPEPGTQIVCVAEGGGDRKNRARRIIDVSAIGVCLETDTPLSEGAAFQVEIVLAGSKARHTARGLVRWSQSLEHNGDVSHTAGLEFEAVVEALAGRSGDSATLDIFLTLRVSVAQLRLYPKESPQVLKVVTDTYHSIHSYLENAGSLTLSKTPKGLLVNGRRLGATGTVAESLETAMLSFLEDAGVKSITFKKGLQLEELITFLHALTKKFWDVKDGKEINRRLREERVIQVSVDEVQYVALGEGDIVIEDAARKFAGGETQLGRLMSNLDQVLESTSGDLGGQELRLQIVKKLLDRDPNLLKQVDGGDGGAAAAAPSDEGRLPFEVAQEAMGDLAQLLRELATCFHAPVRRIGQAFVRAFQGQPHLAQVMEALLAEAEANAGAQARVAAAAGEGPQAGVREAPALARARAILQMDDDARVQALAQEGVGLTDELAALGRRDLVQSLLASVGGLLLDRQARRRLSAARTLNGLRRGVERNASEEVVDEYELSIRTALDLERDASVYSVLAEMISFLADYRIRRGRVDRAREDLELLNRHYLIKDPSFPQRGELAYIALERVASGAGFASIAEQLRRGDLESTRVLEALDAAATRFLLREIKVSESPAGRLHFAQFIARAGAGAATVLADELQKTTAPSDVLRLMEVLPAAMPREMAEMALGGLLRHAAVALRRRAAAMIAEQGYPRGGQLLMDALAGEPDAPTRLAFVEALGKLRHRPALDLLCGIVDARQEPEELRSAACVALGRIADPRAVAVLARVYARGERGLTKVFRLVPAGVRASAARALAFFPGHKEAREALKRAREDHDPSVRAVVNQALYAPLQEVFGEMALGVALVTAAPQLAGSHLNVGGSVQEVPLEALCRRIAETESGGLLLFSAAGVTGRAWFDAGLLIAAEIDALRDQDALREILNRREGLFLFRAGELSPERRVLAPLPPLLEAAARARKGD